MAYEVIDYGSCFAVLRDDGNIMFTGEFDDCLNWLMDDFDDCLNWMINDDEEFWITEENGHEIF